jgi:hypothetical protein
VSDSTLTVFVKLVSAYEAHFSVMAFEGKAKRGDGTMMKTLLASTAILFAVSASALAVAPVQEIGEGFTIKSDTLNIEARRKPRVPGGSGCDDPGDVAEHPECRGKPAPVKKKKSKRADVIEFSIDSSVLEAKRRKPRVPGGSGCDDARDLIEHPECRVKRVGAVDFLIDETQEAERRKPRVPGGSGCDDARDLIEHPECRVRRG